MSSWQPTTTLSTIKARAKLMQQIRAFFAERDVLEVETPVLAKHGVTDVNIEMIPATLNHKGSYFLQTSPEYAMKRLLVKYPIPIFQITKSFRNEEEGKLHNPEFTMLEWYRPGFDHFDLMKEADALLQVVLKTKPAQKISYKSLFMEFLQLDPIKSSVKELQQCCLANGIDVLSSTELEKDDWLSLLFSNCLEPNLKGSSPWIVYDYPATQAALAKINPEDNTVAQRFEVYVQGVELANGYHELICERQHRQRFINDNDNRSSKGKITRELDEHLLSALKVGLANCSGIALGIDRLLMLQLEAKSISEVINFPIDIS